MDDTNKNLTEGLPDPQTAARVMDQFAEKHPGQHAKLLRNRGLLSDVLTLASFSPLLGATLIQNPEYVPWLDKKRRESVVATKDDLLESLARFALANSSLNVHVMLARFRRRELLRIYLRDIRRLATIAEITEEISNLADAILEYALRNARRELDNLYGIPLESDDKGRSRPAEFCIVSLGKLGSKELNYASDIDLLFIYSAEGTTSGQGERAAVTNREYFIKLSQKIIKIVGGQTGEGAAYRVDLRLRPHGTIGPLAQSLHDTIRYYRQDARRWEMQVLIRSRSSAGDAKIFSQFIGAVDELIFSIHETAQDAIANVRVSKQRIDLDNKDARGFNVKLGRGGIREIEFIAQGLQLAYGGRDRWVRAPHTLISLSRLADRHLLTESELTELSAAYDFLRRLEHVLQMENGLQTHTVPGESRARTLTSLKMNCETVEKFNGALANHTANVNRIFRRIFGDDHTHALDIASDASLVIPTEIEAVGDEHEHEENEILGRLQQASPRFTALLDARPELLHVLEYHRRDYESILTAAVKTAKDFGGRLAALRRSWSELLLEIVVADVMEKIDLGEAKLRQTGLAEGSLAAALEVTKSELAERLNAGTTEFSFAILALGKLGGGSVDYESDLDIIFVFDETIDIPAKFLTATEFYSRAAEIFVTTLSGITRDGSLYRIDLRLRPYGKNGPVVISDKAFLEYMRATADIWELLAFVKIRGVGGDLELARSLEQKLRSVIHERALRVDRDELRAETTRIRDLLEQQRVGRRPGKDVDIKYGAGGLLDVYFAMRYLQLANNIPDEAENRSTIFMLEKLRGHHCITATQHGALAGAYTFLSTLDHHLRLTLGRTTRIPLANNVALDLIAQRMHLGDRDRLFEQLTVCRINTRAVFEEILAYPQ